MGQTQSKSQARQEQEAEVEEDFFRDLRKRPEDVHRKRSGSIVSSISNNSSNAWKRFKCYFGFSRYEIPDDDYVEEEEQFEIIDPEMEAAAAAEEDPFLQFPFLRDPRSVQFVRENKTMIVLRGLSGSGKSTIVRDIVRVFGKSNVTICSADDFFVNQEGKYVYDKGLISQAHTFSQARAREACENGGGVNIIVVDNTNVLRWEMSCYFSLAAKHGYRVILAEPKTSWKLDSVELAKRNGHGVPLEVIAKKVGQFKDVMPLYFAWFVNRERSQVMLDLGRDWLLRCITECPDFREDFERFSNRTSLSDMLNYYNRDECQPSNKDKVHCTAKFCGKEGCPDYVKRKAVVECLGKVFDLALIGFVVSERTFGARVGLSEGQLDLWDQDEEEEKKKKKQEKKSGKRKSKSKGKNLKKEEDENVPAAAGGAESLLASLRLEDLEYGDRFYPIPGKGRRAHVTLGTSAGIPPVITGLDVLEVVNAEELASHGKLEFDSFDLAGGTVLRKYGEGLWVIYPEKKAVFEAMFTGHY